MSAKRLGITTVALQSLQHRPSFTGSALFPWSHPLSFSGSMGKPQIEHFMLISFAWGDPQEADSDESA